MSWLWRSFSQWFFPSWPLEWTDKCWIRWLMQTRKCAWRHAFGPRAPPLHSTSGVVPVWYRTMTRPLYDYRAWTWAGLLDGGGSSCSACLWAICSPRASQSRQIQQLSDFHISRNQSPKPFIFLPPSLRDIPSPCTHIHLPRHVWQRVASTVWRVAVINQWGCGTLTGDSSSKHTEGTALKSWMPMRKSQSSRGVWL